MHINCGEVYTHEDGNTRVLFDKNYFSHLTLLAMSNLWNEFIKHPLYVDYVEMLTYDVDDSKLDMRCGILARLYLGTHRSFNHGRLSHGEMVELFRAELSAGEYDNYYPYYTAVEDVTGIGLAQQPVEYVPSSFSEEVSYCQIQEHGIGEDEDVLREEDVEQDVVDTVSEEFVLHYTKAKLFVSDEVANAYMEKYHPRYLVYDDPFKLGYCYFSFFKKNYAMLLYGVFPGKPPKRLCCGNYEILKGIATQKMFIDRVNFKVVDHGIHVKPYVCDDKEYIGIDAYILWQLMEEMFMLIRMKKKFTWSYDYCKFIVDESGELKFY
jgi:hypothetical protein